jgi:hypothetical protein
MNRCDELRETVVAEGAAALEEAGALREHLDTCDACRRFVDALEAVDRGLDALPERPASAALAARVLAEVGSSPAPAPAPALAPPAPRRPSGAAAALAACIVAAASIQLAMETQRQVEMRQAMAPGLESAARLLSGTETGSLGVGGFYERAERARPPAGVAPAPEPAAGPAERDRAASKDDAARPVVPGVLGGEAEAKKERAREPRPVAPVEKRKGRAGDRAASVANAPASDLDEADAEALASSGERPRPPARAGFQRPWTGPPLAEEEAATGQKRLATRVAPAPPAAGARAQRGAAPASVAGAPLALALAEPPTDEAFAVEEAVAEAPPALNAPSTQPTTAPRATPRSATGKAASGALRSSPMHADEPARTEAPAAVAEREAGMLAGGASFADIRAPGDAARPAAERTPDTDAGAGTADRRLGRTFAQSKASRAVPPGAGDVASARAFLASRRRLDGLAFQPASGYWANTYVPGDPDLRLLETRLGEWDRRILRARLGTPAVLEETARPNWQPFDPPVDAALAAYLHADFAEVNGPTRVRIQVGLRGSERQGGYRPPMNVGLVLDRRGRADDATSARLRALVLALAQAKAPGDRFSLTVAGDGGGVLVRPEDFRHGPLVVALDSVFGGHATAGRPVVDLERAVALAGEIVRERDDPGTPLGASLVLLASTAPMGAGTLERLVGHVHRNAVDGIGFTGVAVGPRASLPEIDRLVLAGQGQRRLLGAASEARELVDRELHASSRAVARAVRLRIQLAPGVRLVGVLGSHRLDDPAAERVRQVEQSIDRRLARNLGIAADRGEDEAGIQIVVPSFLAGDTHVVLLDAVVPGPGPVADLTVRYKDLVWHGNGVARARLALGAGDAAPGPLERNVLKNELAHRLSLAARDAGTRLAAGDPPGARAILARFRSLLGGLRAVIPAWREDREILRDEAMLAQFAWALGQPAVLAGESEHLADALRFAAWRRLMAGDPAAGSARE